MTSQLNVDTIADKAGTGPVGLTKQSAAKAWVNFNGTGTIAADDSLNVSSLSDGGTGLYDINVASAFARTNHCSTGSIIGDGSTSNRSYALVASISGNNTTKIDISTVNANVTEAYRDFANINVIDHGDLA
jgi:hypothetical protein